MVANSRRKMLKNTALAGAGIAAGSVLPSPAPASAKISSLTGESKWDSEYNFGHTILFMEEYHQGTMKILGGLEGELEHIGELTSRAANVIKNGGTVWTSNNTGHMAIFECADTLRGNPGVMKTHGDYRDWNYADLPKTKKIFQKCQKGDMVFYKLVQ